MDCWYIVQTTPNSELKAAAEIRRAGFRAYLPKMVRCFRHHRTKRLELHRRIAMAGYVFIRFPANPNFLALRECRGVRGVLCVDGQPYRLARQQVASLMRSQRAMKFDEPNARAERRGRLAGDRNLALKERFLRGSRVVDNARGIIATVRDVTSRGTILAVADFMGDEVPVEFRAPDDLRVLAA
jgi:transcription antitermination factor NusG